ncbi:hypothetical protein E2C01_044045 [Portunus trituberculatus]|uniref:Uncharacterized protein n=1 Tax=Portunus trituberculatus TaxID=210409 RepID=A0A5B7FUI9_PORTR|nr:hypothetical protein [Portunus trituberculatus]
MLIYAAMMCSFANSDVEKICSLLSIKHFARMTYTHYYTFIKEQTLEHIKDVLKRSREALFHYYSEELDRQLDVSGDLDMDVSFDGT